MIAPLLTARYHTAGTTLCIARETSLDRRAPLAKHTLAKAMLGAALCPCYANLVRFTFLAAIDFLSNPFMVLVLVDEFHSRFEIV